MVKATRSSAAKGTTSRSAAAKGDAATTNPAATTGPAAKTTSAAKRRSVAATGAAKSPARKSTPKDAAAPVRARGTAAKRTPAATRAARCSKAAPTKAAPTKATAAKATPTKASGSGKTSPARTAKAGSATATPCAPIELGYLSGFVGFHLRLAQDASYRAFARIKDKELVKPGRYPALAIIHLNPGISQSALGRAIARDKSTVSPLIKDLQTNGFISRKPSPNDRRSVTLALTKKGERVLDRLHARALEHEGDLDKILGTAKGRLVAVLDKITGGLAAA